MKLKEFLILLLIITAGIIFYHAQTGNLDLYMDWDNAFLYPKEVYTFKKVQKIGPPFPNRIEVINQYGDIKIYASEENEISLYTEKKVPHKTEKEAEQAAKKINIQVTRNSEKIIVSTIRDKYIRSGLRTELEFTVPKGFDFIVSNSYGNVVIKGAKNAEINNRNGKVSASNIEENLNIKTSYKTISADNIEGDCQIEGLRSHIKVTNIKGKTIIKNKYGSIYLENLNQNVTVNGPHCQIKGKTIGGPMEVENSYQPIELSDIESVKITADNSPITVNKARKSLDIKDKYSRVQLNEINGNINIEGQSLEIKGSNLQGDLISLSSSYRKIELDHFSSELFISQAHGKVTLSPSTEHIKPLTVKGSYTEIELIIPSGIKLPIQAQTKSGQIKWGLSRKGIEQVSNGYSIVKAFMEKDQQPTISLITTYGNIQIHEKT